MEIAHDAMNYDDATRRLLHLLSIEEQRYIKTNGKCGKPPFYKTIIEKKRGKKNGNKKFNTKRPYES